jgi:ATP-binding cassette subfamily B protein
VSSGRRWIVPEVVQSAATDCGPAALTSLLEGFGIYVSYGRLREACQTDVDGSSIDELERVARSFGLDAVQTMLPADHLFLPEAEALPAIAVVRQPSGVTHFVVVWSRAGSLIQIMDPGVGRRWVSQRDLQSELYEHRALVGSEEWRAWAASDDFLRPLRVRLRRLRIANAGADVSAAVCEGTWQALATVDAAGRMIASLMDAGCVRRGKESSRLWDHLIARTRAHCAGDLTEAIPERYWSVREAAHAEDGRPQLSIRGAVLLCARRDTKAQLRTTPQAEVSHDLAAALDERPVQPTLELLRALRADGLLAPGLMVAAIAVAAATVVIEAVLVRGALDVGRLLITEAQRWAAIGCVLVFAVTELFLELALGTGLLRMGRRLESRLRMALLRTIPVLEDRYLGSRPVSDMAERAHAAHRIRHIPELGGRLLRTGAELLATAVGLAWLDPANAGLAVAACAVNVALPLAMQRLLAERDLRVRTLFGSLGRLHLDVLLGLGAVKAHGAERAMGLEHESLLAKWVRAGRSLLSGGIAAESIQTAVGFGMATLLLFRYFDHARDVSGVLLYVYWALNLHNLGREFAATARQYPVYRSITLRLLEPLRRGDAPVAGSTRTDSQRSTVGERADPSSPQRDATRKGSLVRLENVTAIAAGRSLLQDIDLRLEPGEHVAVLGRSGAGKSSLLALLLGFHRPAQGRVLIDGIPLEGEHLAASRTRTAWVDPGVQLWNRPLLDNVCYGSSEWGALETAMEATGLHPVLQHLPLGMRTILGEGGRLLSGGQGQVVRLARALMRPNVQLVLLDEAFRGLDRRRRRELLATARHHWRDATLLCVTHDVEDTLAFSTVLIMEGGRIVEVGQPAALATCSSRYRTLLDAERSAAAAFQSDGGWRRVAFHDGKITEAVE